MSLLGIRGKRSGGSPGLALWLTLALSASGLAGCDIKAYCFAGCDDAAGASGATGSGGSLGTGGEGGDGGATGTGGEGGDGSICAADTENDPKNCGDCGHVCAVANAFPTCVMGDCAVGECIAGAYDIDLSPDNGCEYVCNVPVLGPETCNGLDDDCDGLFDEDDPDLVAPAALCNKTPGTPCAAALPYCTGPGGWTCFYPPEVEVVQGFVRVTETRCDGLDGNCDGQVDEWFVDLGKSCDDGQLGKCRDYGVIVCNPDDTAKTVCDLSAPPDPAPPEAERCNGLDDDCDGLIDEDLAADAFETELVAGTNPPLRVDRYEASRPDATGAVPGILESVACSTEGALPWTGGAFSEAEAACAARGPGFRLCTAAELEMACRGAGDTLYPYGASYQPDACNGIGGAGAAVPTGSLAACVVGSPGIFDLSGNVAEWTRTQTNQADAPDRIFQLHGGSYLSPQLGLACSIELAPRAAEGTLLSNIGFRCCHE